MRRGLILAVALASGTVAGAQQSRAQYVIDARILVGNPQDTASMQLVAAPTFRTTVDHMASMNLDDGVDGLRLAVTPSDLGEGRVVLHVVAETRTGGRVQESKFDVLTGIGVSIPTVAPRDAAGGFLLGKGGRPLYVELKTLGIVR